jgi:hypothetical protein
MAADLWTITSIRAVAASAVTIEDQVSLPLV